MRQKRRATYPAQKVFNIAESFRHATLQLVPQLRPGDLRLMVPMAANGALTLELFLKCLLLIEQNEYPETHDAEELFNELSDPSKMRIRTYFDNPSEKAAKLREAWKAQGMMLDFESCLRAGKDAFISFRYAFELKNLRWRSGDIIEGARYRIQDLHPEWIDEYWDEDYPKDQKHRLLVDGKLIPLEVIDPTIPRDET